MAVTLHGGWHRGQGPGHMPFCPVTLTRSRLEISCSTTFTLIPFPFVHSFSPPRESDLDPALLPCRVRSPQFAHPERGNPSSHLTKLPRRRESCLSPVNLCTRAHMDSHDGEPSRWKGYRSLPGLGLPTLEGN